MRSFLFLIFFLVHFENTYSSSLLEQNFTTEHLKALLPLIRKPWEPSGIRENPEDSEKLKASYLYHVPAGITLGTESYRYIYLEATFKKGAHRSSSFLSFLKRNGVTNLTPDFLADFHGLTKLFKAEPDAFPCEAFSFYEYFPAKEESYTVTFIKQTDPRGSRSRI